VSNIGPMELIIVLVIVLVIFGPKRLPGLGKQLGSGMREFKDSISGSNKDDDDAEERVVQTTTVKTTKPVAPERADVETALGRPEGEQAPLEGEVVRERTPR
jgi:sec-independent protein translocase protein TatA